MSPSTNILTYPIDSVANIVNSIKDDKIGKRAKFCILDELQHFRNVLFGLFARSSDSSPNRLLTTSLFTHAPKEKRAKRSGSTRGGGPGSGPGFNDHIKLRENRELLTVYVRKLLKSFRMTLRVHCSASSNCKSRKTSVVKFTACVLGWPFLIM